ncbi:DNA gyrase inhibitor YacG [Zavarzinia compransoris]|uniref:DNA gyrase inhibitor YacG n=1 Tax=Zavarzinia compransoris TaxID=1264899 RepID=A0A317DZZ9_9PROT|nr:DNA gyrase inhibitor YacG [Zavarzinia compransoris]PWR18673.1 DNA gyrase inhibitor YacG [Zavarzinia compransoris]TDP48647.1 hypothetical protein DES42_1013 [Zavarzinia compransoris]
MKSGPANDNPRPCPICQRPAAEKYRPFCSARCADIDLHRWLGGAYTIPVVETDPSEEDSGEP